MATIKYTGTTTSSNGLEYTVEIHDLDYSGASTDVVLAPGGFSLKYEGDGGEGPFMNPIYTSSCSVSIRFDDDTMLDYLLSLVQKQEKKGYIAIKLNGNYIWGGRILTDLGQYVYNEKDFFTLTATDGLKTLKSLDFTPLNFTILSGGVSLLQDILQEIFNKLYPTSNYFYLGTLGMWTFNQVCLEDSQSSNVNRPSQIRMNTLAFLQELEKPLSFWDVLEMLCTAFGLRCIYANGSYHLWQWKAFDQYDAIDISYYDENGYVGVQTLDTTQLLTPATTDRKWVSVPTVSFLSMLKRASIEYTAPNRVGPDGWESPDGEAVFTGSNGQFTPIHPDLIQVPFTGVGSVDMQNIPASAGSKLKMSVSWDIDQQIARKVNVVYVVVNCRDHDNPTSIKRLTNVETTWLSFDPDTLDPKQIQWVDEALDEFYMILNPGLGRNGVEILTPELPFTNNDISVNVYFGHSYDYKFKCKTVSGSTTVKTTVNVVGFPSPLYFIGPGISNWKAVSPYVSIGQNVSYTMLSLTNQTSNIDWETFWFLNPDNLPVSGDEVYVTCNLDIRQVTDTAMDSQDGYKYIAENSQELSDEAELKPSFIGDLINGRQQQAIEVMNNGSNWVWSDAWAIPGGSDVAAPLLEKLVEYLALQRSSPIQVWQGVVASFGVGIQTLLHYTLVKPGKTFLFNGGTFTADNDEIDGEWLAWESHEPSGDIGITESDTVSDRNGNDPVVDQNQTADALAAGGVSAGLGVARQAINEVREFAREIPYNDPGIFVETGGTPTGDGTDRKVMLLTNGKMYQHNGTDWQLKCTYLTTSTGMTNALTNGKIWIGNGSNVAAEVTPSLSGSAGAFAVSNAGVFTFPDADTSTRGFVNSGSQTLGGPKTIEYNNGINSGTTDVVAAARRSSSGAGVILGYYSRNGSSADVAFIGGNSTTGYIGFGKANTVYGFFDSGNNGVLHIASNIASLPNVNTATRAYIDGAVQFGGNRAITSLITTSDGCGWVYCSSVYSGSQGDVVLQSRTIAGKAVLLVTGSTPAVRFRAIDTGTEMPFNGKHTRIGSTNNKATDNYILYGATTDAATAVELTTDGAAGSGTSNRIVVPNNAALSIVLNICVKQSGSANARQMLRQVVISNNGGTTAIQGTVIALGTDSGSAGLATVTCTITANDTNDALKVEVNGVASTNLRYTCYIVSCETTYA